MIPFTRRVRRLFPAPGLRRRRERGSRPEAALERLEDRTLLAAGSVIWQNANNLLPTDSHAFYDVAVQADGKIVAVGARFGTDADFLVARYNPGGTLDTSFAGGVGFLVQSFQTNSQDTAAGVAIQADGKIVVGGTTVSNDNIKSFALVRYNRDGSLDTTYGTNGLTIEDYPANDITMNAMAMDQAGRIYAVGVKQHATDPADGVVARFGTNGRTDNTFDGNGFKEILGLPVFDVAVDQAARPVVIGAAGEVARLTTAGAFDTTFSQDGIAIIDAFVQGGATPTTRAVDVAADGKIVIAGHSVVGGQFRPGVVRLQTGGALDTAFADGGRLSFDVVAGSDDYLFDVEVLANGSILVGGHNSGTGRDWTLAAITPAGQLDAGFGGGGITRYPAGGTDNLAALAVTQDGHYLVAGSFNVNTNPLRATVAQFQGRFGRRDDLLGWTAGGEFYAARSTGTAFTNSAFGTMNRNAGWRDLTEGDFNADGQTDVAGRDSAGNWWIGFNAGNRLVFNASIRWNEAAGWRDVRFGDFNGDGLRDVAGRTSYGEWWVTTSLGTGQTTTRRWDVWAEAAGWRDVLAADFTGDGRTDLAGRTSYGEWWVTTSTGQTFAQSRWAGWNEGAGWRDVGAADFNGDGRADVAGRASNGEWYVGLSSGAALNTALYATWNEAAQWRDVRFGDFDGDGRADVAGRTAAGQWYVGVSTIDLLGRRFTTSLWDRWNESLAWRDVRVGDYDGDGVADLAGRTSGGEWHVARSTKTAFTTTRWSQWTEEALWTTFRGEFQPTT